MSTEAGETEGEKIRRITEEEIPLDRFLVRLGRAINWILTRPKAKSDVR